MSEQLRQARTLDELRVYRDDILRVAAHYGVSNIRVFGSVVRGEATSASDVDFLVDLPAHFSLLKLSGLVRTLQDMLGCRVEVANQYRDVLWADFAGFRDVLIHQYDKVIVDIVWESVKTYLRAAVESLLTLYRRRIV